MQTCPTLLEFDNYGPAPADIKRGVATPSAFWNWGYDDITWFALQPEWYRNEFLLYLDNFMKTHKTVNGKQVYFPMMPMRRVITPAPDYPVAVYKPGEKFSVDFLFDYGSSEKIGINFKKDFNLFQLTTKLFYRVNRQSDGCPNGFGQEDTIRRIFLGKNAPEIVEYNTVVLPKGYTADSAGSNGRASSSDASGVFTSAGSKSVGTSFGTVSSGGESADASKNGSAYGKATESFGSDVSEPGSGVWKREEEKGIVLIIIPSIAGGVLLCGGLVWILIYRKKRIAP